jgi:hypothetical protein
MHACTRPSRQLRLNVRDAHLRSLHQSSLYMRLILANKERGAHTNKVDKAIYSRLLSSHWEGTTLLNFVYCQLYNGNLAKRYGHAPTHECPLCHKPDSCTHFAGECLSHKAFTISRHNAARQPIHAAIRKSAKGGAALHSAPDLVLLTADTESQPQTSTASLDAPLTARRSHHNGGARKRGWHEHSNGLARATPIVGGQLPQTAR